MLTIALPTYNRAPQLDRQLKWLSRVLRGNEDQVEVLISDNASTDETAAMVDFWRPAFAKTDFRYRRNPTNIGAVPNIASCMRAASREHVWTISDDDNIDERALGAVLRYLTQRPDLGLLTLNHSTRDAHTGMQGTAQAYPVPNDRYDPRGTELFSYCLDHARGGVALTTALVYRTDLANRALQAWPTEENLIVQAFWSGYCAREGGMLLTGDPYLECITGDHFFYRDPLVALRLYCVDFPEVGARLAGLGMDQRACQKLTLDSIALHQRHTLVRALRAYPVNTVRLLGSFLGYVWRVGPIRAIAYLGGKAGGRVAGRLGARRNDRAVMALPGSPASPVEADPGPGVNRAELPQGRPRR